MVKIDHFGTVEIGLQVRGFYFYFLVIVGYCRCTTYLEVGSIKDLSSVKEMGWILVKESAGGSQ